jgi:hypothetical protein
MTDPMTQRRLSLTAYWLSLVLLGVAASPAMSQQSDDRKFVWDPSLLTGALCPPMPFERLEVGMSYREVIKIVGLPSYHVYTPINSISMVEYHTRTGGMIQLTFAELRVTSARVKSIWGRYLNAQGATAEILKTDLPAGAGIAAGKSSSMPFKRLKPGMDTGEVFETVGRHTAEVISPLGGVHPYAVEVHMRKYLVQEGGSVCLWMWDDELAQVDACYLKEGGDLVEFSWSDWAGTSVEKGRACAREGIGRLKLGIALEEVSRMLGPPAREATVRLAVHEYRIPSGGQVWLKFDLQRKVLEGLCGWYVDTSGKDVVYFGPSLLTSDGSRHRRCPELVFRKLRIGMSMKEVAKVAGAAKHERTFRARFAEYKVGTGGMLRLSFVAGKVAAVQGWYLDDSGRRRIVGM